jgi:hypothetical protein
MFEEKDTGTLIREVMQQAFRQNPQNCGHTPATASDGVFERLLERLSAQERPTGGKSAPEH